MKTVKTYVWLNQEKLKFINDHPEVLSLLYDLGLLPEEISARVRGYVEDATKESQLQNQALRVALQEMLSEYPASTFCDVDCTNGSCEHCRLERSVKALLTEKKEGV